MRFRRTEDQLNNWAAFILAWKRGSLRSTDDKLDRTLARNSIRLEEKREAALARRSAA